MHITIEDNKVIVNLDETEFPKFEAMFNNLQLDKTVRCDFRKFNFPDFETKRDILLMHLCRTIGEGRQRPTALGCRKPGKAVFGILVGSVRKEPFFLK